MYNKQLNKKGKVGALAMCVCGHAVRTMLLIKEFYCCGDVPSRFYLHFLPLSELPCAQRPQAGKHPP